MAWLYEVVKLSAKENKYYCYIQKYLSFNSVAVKIYGTANVNSAVERLLGKQAHFIIQSCSNCVAELNQSCLQKWTIPLTPKQKITIFSSCYWVLCQQEKAFEVQNSLV
jgi:hypothetical protein